MNKFRVVSIEAQNIMRLTAIEIAWDKDASTLVVGGANGAGKSSVLNAVAMALGGAALCPEEPIRRGETDGFVELNLGELVVRREFSREKIVVPAQVLSGMPGDYMPEQTKWGETKSRIVVKNAEGIRLGTPQAILDKLIGKLSFDPLAFATEEPKRQDAILRQIVGLDVTDLEAKRKSAFERRAHFNKEYKEGTVRLQAMPTHKDAPAAEVPMSAIADEMQAAEGLRRQAEEAERAVATAEARVVQYEGQCQRRYDKIQDLNSQLEALYKELKVVEKQFTDEKASVDALKVTAEAARAVVPDVAVLKQRLAEAEAANTKVRANLAYAAEAKRVDEIGAKAKVEDSAVSQLEKAKRDALNEVRFPVDGLGLNDDGVTFGGIPFKQASTAEQIKVSVAVGFALNPELKLLLVRNGNALDEDSMRVVAAQAQAAGGQILMEYVTKDAGQVSVMIEDGHVA